MAVTLTSRNKTTPKPPQLGVDHPQYSLQPLCKLAASDGARAQVSFGLPLGCQPLCVAWARLGTGSGISSSLLLSILGMPML